MEKVKIAFATIIKPTDDEIVLMGSLLTNVGRHVDDIFITFAGEKRNKRGEDIVESFGGKHSFYKWDNNFANARNFNFSQVTKDYTHILWADADDNFYGLDKLRKILEDNFVADSFFMNYIYWVDVKTGNSIVHGKTQIIRNNDSVEWAGAIHEDFKTNREIVIREIKDITRIHLTTEERVEKARKRNLDIAKIEVATNEKDPHSYWNLANAYTSDNQNEEALSAYKKFLKVSESDSEKYIARSRMGEVYSRMGEYSKALDMASYAIGMQPTYPDAYYDKARILSRMGKFEDARDHYQMGLVLKPVYYGVIAWNQREYDFRPLMELAQVYVQLSMHQLAVPCLEACSKILPSDDNIKNIIKTIKPEAEKVEKALKKVEKLRKIKNDDKFLKEFNKIPDEIRMHPMLTHMKNRRIWKKESSGKDIVIYCSYTKHEWTPQLAIDEGVGGSEEAIIHLAKGLVKRGWNVEVYNNCGHKELNVDGVVYKPFWSWNPRDKQDILILWRHPKSVDYSLNADRIYLDMHDALDRGELTPDRLKKIDKLFVKSQAQRDLYPAIPDDKFVIIPNGVDLDFFDKQGEVTRDPYYLINMSSADRSLETILEILPEVRKRLSKEARSKMKFGWYYGFGVFDSSHTSESNQKWKKGLVDKMEQYRKEGWFVGGGKINHKQVAYENLKAGAYIYPTEFYEIDFIGGTKAQIAGCVPIMSDFAALDNKIQYGVKIHSDRTIDDWFIGIDLNFGFKEENKKEEFIQAIVKYLENPDSWDKERKMMSEWARAKYNWDKIVDAWDKELTK